MSGVHVYAGELYSRGHSQPVHRVLQASFEIAEINERGPLPHLGPDTKKTMVVRQAASSGGEPHKLREVSGDCRSDKW